MMKYPTKQVIISYSLLGGMIGSFLILPFFVMANLPAFFRGFILFMVIGWVIGFTPALLTGIVLAYLKIRILRKMDYFKTFWVGFGVTFLCFFALNIMSFFRDFDDEIILSFLLFLLSCVVMSLIGGISSTLLAKFILPKS
ncbi:hypothetical protein LP122_12440 [Moraxella bovis]|uniref:hypothetical protein n=1 Tax=Moraxella bovis TaxID=476 RepID=UPI00222675D6|nr:hypothetical protein [Moraxella bovis]UYZ68528.1 hypothetical protein LP122_12440 [Moraxella bovis]UZA27439.1 hypothetical protein LP119_00140 [Moraxella bovis]UZA38027.1 hypothetical protein LP101_12945 [Moraxella bovis]WAJ73633.1 hypothetical protein LP095_00140 [Moraxella bovis]